MKSLKKTLSISLVVLLTIFGFVSCATSNVEANQVVPAVEVVEPVEATDDSAQVVEIQATDIVPVSEVEEVKPFDGKTVILHSNDVHGAIAGYAYIAQLRSDFEAQGADVILVDAGDFSQGDPNVNTTKGLDAVTMMNAAGYDVVTLGNHEFDFGTAQLLENMKSAEFAVICSNVFDAEGNLLFPASTMVEEDGLKIGFVGVETPESQTKANPALTKGLVFKAEDEMFALAQEAIDQLKADGADLVVAVTHLGVDGESEPNRSYDLYENTTGLDFIIDGHSHTVMTEGENGEPIQSTGTKFENIGVVVIDNATATVEDHYLQPVSHEDENGEKVYDLKNDIAVSATAQEIIDRINGEYGVVFAESLVDLNGAKDPGNRTEETNLGCLITDSMMWSVLKDEGSLTVAPENVIAITNGGGIRAPIDRGKITKKDVNTVLPFGNTITVVYLTGSELLEALEASTYCTPAAVGAFPQVAGIEFTVDTTKEYAANSETYPNSTYYGPSSINRVTINSINGNDFDVNATYAIVTNDFMAAGGDTYYAFASASSSFDTGIPLDLALMNYITDYLGGVVGEEYAAPKGQIHIIK